MIIYKKVIIFLALFVFLTSIQAQTIQGTVKDKGFSPIPGVNIVNLSTGAHTHTNGEGHFNLEHVSRGDSVQFSFIGFIPVTRVIKEIENTISIQLEEKSFSLDQVLIESRIDALSMLTDIDLAVDPVNSSQEILRQVPGLFIGQHAGGGKAEQIFLRGFDIDHGTDIALSVDGVPVNMVSHAHGQGYSDLHFLIPELVEQVDFGKGPYSAEHGNFATAGHVDFNTKDRLDNSVISLEVGQFSSRRTLGMFELVDKEKHQAYVATEYITTDGPFESPQNFSRSNLMFKYSGTTSSKDRISVRASTFISQWDASGQIPQRKVDDGSISRFGAIDDTEGGVTSRSDLMIEHSRFIDDKSLLKSSVYLFDYNFDLYSNFTFFLNDSVNGDQIRQTEGRRGLGLRSEYTRTLGGDRLDGLFKFGLSLRNDLVKDVKLSRTLNRSENLSDLKSGDVNETNMGLYTNFSLRFGKFTVAPGLRFDFFDFQYNDELLEAYGTQSMEKIFFSPKLNFLYDQSSNLQYYLKLGRGFHSNDTRVVVQSPDKKTLPGAYGSDIGFIWKPTKRTIVHSALWYLFLQQEFVYVGDEGIVEPSGETQRRGVDLSIRHQLLDWMFANVDVNYTYARSAQEEDGKDFIPLAPDLTMLAGLNVMHPSGLRGGVSMRYLNDRPATEDNSIIAEGYQVVDLNVGYEFGRLDCGIQVQNLFDTEWNETQFATESRLSDESDAVEEIHFTPGTPFFVNARIAYRF